MAKKSAPRGFYLEKTQFHDGKLLNNEELFWKLEEADEEDRPLIIEDIVKNNVRTIHHILQKRFRGNVHEVCRQYRITYEDLFALGCEALLRSIERFDIHRGFKFLTYSYRSIHLDISKYSDRIKIDPKDISIDKEIYQNNDGDEAISLLDMLHTDDVSESIVEARFLIELLEKLSEESTPRNMSIFRKAISGGITQMEIAKEHGITQVHVSRILQTMQKKARRIREEWGVEA